MRFFLAIIVASSIFVSACGVSRGCLGCAAPASPQPSLPAGPAAGFDVLITDHDRDVAVRLGQRIEVYLPQRSGMQRWSQVVADDETVLRPINVGIVVPKDATIGGFLAVKPGVANLTAYATPQCAPNQPCPAYAMLFQVRVTVA